MLAPRDKEPCTTPDTLGVYDHLKQDLLLFQALPRDKDPIPSQAHITWLRNNPALHLGSKQIPFFNFEGKDDPLRL